MERHEVDLTPVETQLVALANQKKVMGLEGVTALRTQAEQLEARVVATYHLDVQPILDAHSVPAGVRNVFNVRPDGATIFLTVLVPSAQLTLLEPNEGPVDPLT